MKKSALISLLICSNVLAQTFEPWDNPSKNFPVENAKFEVTVIATDNHQRVCERESRSRGFGGFGYALNSCAFWNDSKTQCTIVVPKNTSMHILGHELLHCIKGNWH